MYKKLNVILLLVLIFINIIPLQALATPPVSPHIISGTASQGGTYFQFLSLSGTWENLTAPPHYVKETNEIAYCLEHKADSPTGSETYKSFNPTALYSSSTYNGIHAILKNGYPYSTGGFTAKQAKYATANAIRAWLSESAGIGYNFMKLSRNQIRPKSGYQSLFNWMVSLVEKARSNSQPVLSVSVTPSNVKLIAQGDKLTGSVTINFESLNGNYTIDTTSLPAGVEIAGYTGNDEDVLTITAPLLYSGQSIDLGKIITGHDTRASANIYWFEHSGSAQAVAVPTVDTLKPVAYGEISLYSILGSITINKAASDTGQLIDGAVFQLLDSSNSPVTLTQVSDGIYTFGGSITDIQTNNGSAVMSAIPEGSYSISEISPPINYNLDSPTIQIANITEAVPNVTVNFNNTPAGGYVKVIKHGEDDSILLQNAVYGIFKSDDTKIDELTTGADGSATSGFIPQGDYYLQEISSPNGYLLDETKHDFTILSGGQTITINAYNTMIKGRVSIIKYGEENDPLQDAIYGIYDMNDNLIEEITTDENGIAVSSELVYGDYYMMEITPPTGYNLNISPIPFKIREHNLLIELSAENTIIKGCVKVLKTGEENDPLQYAVYSIYDISDNLIEEITTDTNGIAISNELVYGDYFLKEITAPEGYNINSIPIPFSIKEQDITIELTAANTKIRGRIRISKSGEDNGNHLEGAVFGIFTLDNKLRYELSTDENGRAISELIEYGRYFIQEITPPAGHIIDNTRYPVFIEDNDKTIVLNLSNTLIRGQVEIIKTDTETGETLQGAVFGIYNEVNELVEEIETDEKGYAISQSLTYGQYYMKELKSPIGYTVNDEVHQFFIGKDKQVIHFDIENLIIKGKVQILKIGAFDGKLLSGAVFGLYKNDGTLIEELTTNENGIALSSDLDYGDYYIRELTAPTGYILDDIQYPFSIIEDGVTIEIDVKNQPVTGSVEVYFRHIQHGHELYDAGSFTDWTGMEYMPWVKGNNLDKKQIKGYSLVRSDYPSEPVLIDGKLIITYWYDEKVKGSWSDVAIPKTGQPFPYWSYIIAFVCLLLAGVLLFLYWQKCRYLRHRKG